MTADGRRDPRKPTVLKIRFKSATIAEFVEKHSRDVSRGGIFIKMKSPFPPGTLIKFEIQVAEDSMIHGVGRVVWTRIKDKIDDPAGMGVKFIKIEERSRPILEEIITEKGHQKIDDDKDAARFDGPIPTAQAISKAPPPSPSRSSKRTILGMGLPAGGLPVPKPTIPQPTKDVPKEESPQAKLPVPGSGTPMLSREDSGATPVDSSEDELLAGTSEDFVADISSAIDSALDGRPAKGAKEKGAPRDETPGPTAATPEAAEGEEDDEDDHPTREMPAVKGPKPARKAGISPVVWIVLLLVVAGAGVWFYFDKIKAIIGGEAGQTEEETSAAMVQPPPIPETPLPEPAAAEPESPPEQPADPEAPPAEVKVVTIPPGATVYVNGEKREGVTPLVIEDAPLGKETEIKVVRFGFASETKTVVPEKEPITVKHELKKVALKLSFLSKPDNSKIAIDRLQYGATPRNMVTRAFEPEFSLVIESPGYEPLRRNITVEDWTEEDGAWWLKIDTPLEKKTAPEAGETPTVERASASEPSVTPKRKPKKTKPADEEAEAPAAEPKTKPEPKTAPEAQPESKPEPEAKPKPEAKPETKPETEPEKKPEPEPEAKPETKPEAKPETKPEAKPETKPEAKPETKPEPKPEAEPEAKPKPKPEKEKGGIEDNPF